MSYDILGQVYSQSVPTEVSVSGTTWTPAGDDATRGWLWKYQKYDWKGRVIRTINTDGVDSPTLNDSDTLISYEGCGCAGGQVTTIQGELVPKEDGTGNARRTQKVYEDILGRQFKAETYQWDALTVYSTSVNRFNGMDQTLQSRQYAGTTSSTYQDTTMSYDGLGRLHQKHRPEQRDISDNLKYTTYSYNLDNSISKITDGRGADTNYTYNSVGLATKIGWAAPVGSGIKIPKDVAFSYDNVGNRIQMIDDVGQVDYEYNSLSLMSAETRDFTDNLPNAPIPGSKYRLDYTYTLSGQLKSYTDGTGRTITLFMDKSGRLSSVAGTTTSGTTTYASNPRYRAWGVLSHLEYGNGTEMNAGGFNNKLQATTFEVHKGTTSIMNKAYDFYSDGSVKTSFDGDRPNFDKLIKPDFAGRTIAARSGVEAHGSTGSSSNIPFKNDYTYDAFGHLTSDTSKHYSSLSATESNTYLNNRLTGNLYWDDIYNPTYDDEGNQLKDLSAKKYSYDAAGRLGKSHVDDWNQESGHLNQYDELMSYDGDGKMVKIDTIHQRDDDPPNSTPSFQLRSSVMNGDVVAEIENEGTSFTQYVRAGETLIASIKGTSGSSMTYWSHRDPTMGSFISTDANGDVYGTGGSSDDRDLQELDALGKSLDFTDLYLGGGPPAELYDLFSAGNSFNSGAAGHNTTFSVDGVQVPESLFRNKIESGLVGGFFGMIEQLAMASRGEYLGSTYTYRDHDGNTWNGLDKKTAYIFQKESHGQIAEQRFWLVSELIWRPYLIRNDCKTKDMSKDEGSKAINSFIKENCQ